ncbi:MAG: hypothetical protein EBZ44_05550 [Verrucomicrobia bacterium]|nr:hypothetical protein [Verrucomicrobiota bacterium]
MDLIDAALRSQKPNPRFAYVAPLYVQAKDVAWGYLKMYAAQVPGVAFNEGELRVDFPHNGARIRLYGADNYDRLRGLYLDGIVLDEYADMDPRAWPEVIRPALADRKGWAIFIGTPKGRNAFYDIYEMARRERDWFALMLRASESGLVDAAELVDAQKMLTPEQYAQEFECSFDAAITGAYYGREVADAERAGRIRQVPVDAALPVHTAWDLGIGDSTAIWFFQIAPDGLRVVDYYESHGHGLGHYVAELNARGYRYGLDFVPHDARVRELGTGRTRVETLQEYKRTPQLVPAHTVMDGINAARVSFPRIWFDADRCKFGLEALRQYRAEFDDKTKAFKNNPRHDWTSHCADAFRYMAMAWKEYTAPAEQKPKAEHVVFEVREDGRIHSNMSVKDIIEMKRRKRLAANG